MFKHLEDLTPEELLDLFPEMEEYSEYQEELYGEDGDYDEGSDEP